MESIRDYFQKGIEKAGSVNRLASALQTSHPNLLRVINHSGFPGDETVIRLADYLGENQEKLLLINQAERAPEGARGQWQTIMKKFAGAAAIAFIVATVLSALPCLSSAAGTMYIMSNVIFLSIALLIFSPRSADTISI
jgi:hypothetical protein